MSTTDPAISFMDIAITDLSVHPDRLNYWKKRCLDEKIPDSSLILPILEKTARAVAG